MNPQVDQDAKYFEDLRATQNHFAVGLSYIAGDVVWPSNEVPNDPPMGTNMYLPQNSFDALTL